KLGREWRRCAMGGLVRSMDWSFAIHGPTTTRVERLQLVTQMVHDPREQVLPQRFEDLRQNGPSGEGGTQLPPTSTGSSIDGHHPNGCLTHSDHLTSVHCRLIIALST
ncbi:hypothetical protein KIN20_012926, partial [Parelaphostrongylus tenuis]